MNKEKGHSSGNGHQREALRRELRSIENRQSQIQNQLDRAVKLADQEIGMSGQRLSSSPDHPITGSPDRLPLTPAPLTTTGGLPVPGVRPIPPTPAPEKISISEYTARLEQGWVPVVGLSGTPITAGFLRELGEYNPKLEGINGIWTYQEMRRGDGQVAGTLRACKLPILSAQWNVVAPPVSELGNPEVETGNSKLEIRNSSRATEFRISIFGFRIRAPGGRLPPKPRKLPTSSAKT